MLNSLILGNAALSVDRILIDSIEIMWSSNTIVKVKLLIAFFNRTALKCFHNTFKESSIY